MTAVFDPADLDLVVTALRGAEPDLVECSLDASELNLPGVWVALDEVRADRLRGTTLAVRLFLIVPDGSPRSTLDALAALYEPVRARADALGLTPNGPATTTRVTIPGVEGRPMPALSVPYLVHTSPA